MPCAVLKLSQKGRIIFVNIFNTLSILLALISFSMVVNSIFIIIKTEKSLYSEKATLLLVFTVIGTIAMQLTIFYTAGIYVSKVFHSKAHKKSSKCLSRAWVFCGYGYLLTTFIISFKAAALSNDLVQSMHHSMSRGMKHYLTDMKWKKNIDILQFKMQCCGSYDYSDWHETPWLSRWLFNNFNETIAPKYKVSGNKVYVPAVPWSCCKLDYNKQCLHDPIQQHQWHSVWDDVAALTINHDGCVEMIRHPVENAVLIFILGTIALIILQILQTIISRYLYTSFRNSVLLGDPGGAAPGWLFDLRDVGIKKGRTASQIMFGKHKARESIPLPSEPDSEDRFSIFENETESSGSNYSIDEEENLLMK